MQAPCRQSRSTHPVCPSCGQPRISEALALYGSDETVQPIKGVALHVPGVQPEGNFIHIAAQVLDTDLMVDSVDSTFQERPNAFDSICRSIPAPIFSAHMVDRLMLKEDS